ncbi:MULTISPECIES: glutamine synthetase family protein [unclassified Halomonas]|uniref:glutamine synthetase family protein n=1 Tax=unclassified Halomonas TaxID=2609666 RepID=UPI001C9599AF|nr:MULTISPECIES: glutamine synthetase family protein [unclassified Halomonas]MED5295687.1 glutamine synthetase family protein [Pseudomonadota bacterium]MBY5926136.1 glutamine synthetase family protein [Halomonas sp. DP4Y7-2]MBY5984696.1 glutamine synthetase family protein [Halomonas sp. DP5Y7-2]MBY6031004.1 glutamine synthetase family protein [Halomonas sp. DP8Y7-1]MBY6233178.1 glutamine synthetase family protein [Halomonas sp. DP4Y7-1]
MSTPGVDEARDFLQRHPEIDSVDLLISDLNGVLRGKRIPTDNLEKAFVSGIALPGSVFALDITGNTVEETGLGLDIGDRDQICRPVPGSLMVAPWQRDGRHAQLLMSMRDDDDGPFFADPRNVLAAQVQRLSDRGFKAVVALELEFYLVDRARDELGMAQPCKSPASGERAKESQLYSISELDEYADFLEEVHAAAKTQQLPLDTALKECAPGQFEINLIHGDDVLKACDSAVLLKRLIKGVALRHGFEATFMAKPYGGEAGNGMHVHMSLVDQNGDNVFADPDENPHGSRLLGNAIAGLMELMPASMALFAPNLNSFRRFQPGLYVPMTPCWGYDNRSVALRIPSGANAARRVEHRVAGADANPYLLLATLLASVLHGLASDLTPPEATTGNAYRQLTPTLTNSWSQALDLLEDSAVLAEALGRDFLKVFVANRRAERELAMQSVSRLEYDWYLRHV